MAKYRFLFTIAFCAYASSFYTCHATNLSNQGYANHVPLEAAAKSASEPQKQAYCARCTLEPQCTTCQLNELAKDNKKLEEQLNDLKRHQHELSWQLNGIALTNNEFYKVLLIGATVVASYYIFKTIMHSFPIEIKINSK